MKRISLPEPKVLKELHAIRRKIQRRAEKIGWEKYLKELNEQPSILTRKPEVVREKPLRKYGSQKG